MNTLIIIDMQKGSFVDPGKFDLQGVIDRINKLSNHIRENNGKVIFVQHDGTAADRLIPHSSDWEILDSLTQSDTDIIVRKTTNDSFYETSLNEQLKALGSEQLIISGWATDLCVDSTIRSAVSLRYEVTVASDGHTVSHRPNLKADLVIAHHNWLWANLLTPGKSVEVKTTERLIADI